MSKYKESISLLRGCGVEFETGFAIEEIDEIERIYGIRFPESLKSFLMEGLPVSTGFYNWRDTSDENVIFIKQMIERPFKEIMESAEDVEWYDGRGDVFTDKEACADKVREMLKSAPVMIPVYSHRYIPMLSDEELPIISIHGADIIYYGENLEEYFKVEFGDKRQEDISFEDITRIPFWSDIM